MQTASLNRKEVAINDGNDSIIIVRDLGDIPGGRTLDTTGYTPDTIPCGMVVIKKANGDYAPHPLATNGKAYAASAGTGNTIVGVVKYTVLTADPRVAIMTMGQINQAACAIPFTDAIKTALKHIDFLY